MKKVLPIILSLVVLLFILFSVPHIFSELWTEMAASQTQISVAPIDFDDNGTYVWTISPEQWEYPSWSYHGQEAQLMLEMDRSTSSILAELDNTNVDSEIELDVVAISEDGAEYNRQMLNDDYSKNPFASKTCGSVSNDEVRHCIALVWVYPEETIKITLADVYNGDILQERNGRLILVGQHDRALPGHWPMFLAMKWGAFAAALVSLFGLTYLALRQKMQW